MPATRARCSPPPPVPSPWCQLYEQTERRNRSFLRKLQKESQDHWHLNWLLRRTKNSPNYFELEYYKILVPYRTFDLVVLGGVLLFIYTCIWYCVCVHSCLVMSDSLWPHEIVAHQAPLSMEFSTQEYWDGLPFPSPGDLPEPGIEPESPVTPALVGGFFTTWATWEAHNQLRLPQLVLNISQLFCSLGLFTLGNT